MNASTKRIITGLAEKLTKVPPPIHLLAVCSGGITVARHIRDYLRYKNIQADYFEVWTNTINGKRSFRKTNFTRKDYKGTAVIVEDVIWKGGALPPIKKKLREMNRKKKPLVVAILDCNKKADFAAFR